MDSHECTNTSRQLKSLFSLTLGACSLSLSLLLSLAVSLFHSPASIDSVRTARALCCSWMCIINTVRANSAKSPIISRGKLYVNAPLMASFVNGIVVQARGIEPCPESRDSIRSSMPRVVNSTSPGHSFLYCLFLSDMYTTRIRIPASVRARVCARARSRETDRFLGKRKNTSWKISLRLIFYLMRPRERADHLNPPPAMLVPRCITRVRSCVRFAWLRIIFVCFFRFRSSSFQL